MFCGAGREALRCCTERVEGSVLAQGRRLQPFRLAFILLSFKSFNFTSRLPCSTWRRLAEHTPSPPAWTEGSSCTYQPATSQHKMFSFLALSKHSSEAVCLTRASLSVGTIGQRKRSRSLAHMRKPFAASSTVSHRVRFFTIHGQPATYYSLPRVIVRFRSSVLGKLGQHGSGVGRERASVRPNHCPARQG